MTNSLDSFIDSGNFKAISGRGKGEWLEASSSGQISVVKGFLGKTWFVIRNFLTFGGLSQRTAKAVSANCHQFFKEICLNCPSSLEANNPLLLKHKEVFQKLGRSIQRMSPKFCEDKVARKVHSLVACPELLEATLALEEGIAPSLIQSCVGGTYILYNRQRDPWAIFKPKDEEPGCKDNPKGYVEKTDLQKKMKNDIGKYYLREKAAYLLDHEHFANVPFTEIVQIPRKAFMADKELVGTINAQIRQVDRMRMHNIDGETKKIDLTKQEPEKTIPEPIPEDSYMEGSFQKFIPNCTPVERHYQPLRWPLSLNDGYKIPGHEIRKIAILDIRLLNADRHLHNILVDAKWKTHPIDHGLTLPASAAIIRFNWMNMLQSREPFTKEELAYIERLDPIADVALLKREHPSLSSDVLMRIEISGMLLKKAAKRGLTAFEIGDMIVSKETFFAELKRWFAPKGSWATSQFEKEIFPKVYKAWPNIDTELDRAIDRYLATRSVFLR